MTSAAAVATRPAAGRLWRVAVGVLGEVLITAGCLLLLLAVYQLFWTGVETGRAQDRLRADLLKDWAAPAPAVPTPAPGAGSARRPARPAPPPPAAGEPVLLLRIPRLGPDFEWVVLEGVRPADLKRGPGHYPGTALPGEVGNVAIAGHRATNGEPFAYLDRLREGDEIVTRTRAGEFTYRVTGSRIVAPTRTDVVLPVPGRPGATPTRRLLTLTTCHPRWGSTSRLIVSAQLVG